MGAGPQISGRCPPGAMQLSTRQWLGTHRFQIWAIGVREQGESSRGGGLFRIWVLVISFSAALVSHGPENKLLMETSAPYEIPNHWVDDRLFLSIKDFLDSPERDYRV